MPWWKMSVNLMFYYEEKDGEPERPNEQPKADLDKIFSFSLDSFDEYGLQPNPFEKAEIEVKAGRDDRLLRVDEVECLEEPAKNQLEEDLR